MDEKNECEWVETEDEFDVGGNPIAGSYYKNTVLVGHWGPTGPENWGVGPNGPIEGW